MLAQMTRSRRRNVAEAKQRTAPAVVPEIKFLRLWRPSPWGSNYQFGELSKLIKLGLRVSRHPLAPLLLALSRSCYITLGSKTSKRRVQGRTTQIGEGIGSSALETNGKDLGWEFHWGLTGILPESGARERGKKGERPDPEFSSPMRV